MSGRSCATLGSRTGSSPPTRHPRPLLLSLEQAHRPALAHHVHRLARLGIQVLISGTWYQAARAGGIKRPSLRDAVVRFNVEGLRPGEPPPRAQGGGLERGRAGRAGRPGPERGEPSRWTPPDLETSKKASLIPSPIGQNLYAQSRKPMDQTRPKPTRPKRVTPSETWYNANFSGF
jgi:hypothetical protein